MNKLLAVAAIVAMMTACSGLSRNNDDRAFNGPGAAGAAALGYHGPAHRIPAQYSQ